MSTRLTPHKVDASQPVTAGPGQLTTAVHHSLYRGLAGCSDELGVLLTVDDDVGGCFQGPVHTSK